LIDRAEPRRRWNARPAWLVLSFLRKQNRRREDLAAAERDSWRRAADTVEATLRLYLKEKKQTLAPRLGHDRRVERRPVCTPNASLAVGVLCVVHGRRPR
jgi:hypothetical protein